MDQMLHVSSNPHVRDKMTTSKIMQLVALALLPATLFGIYNFGLRALLVVVITVASSVFFEWIYDKLMHKKNTITDFSAVVTGLLLALNMPASIPLWMPVLGSAFAIIVVKQLFGGLGQNFMNPALAGRCFLMISFAGKMTDFAVSDSFRGVVDTVSGATPLAALKQNGFTDSSVSVLHMFIGDIQGTIGETSALAILIGAAILLVFKVIDLKIPLTYIGSFAVFVILYMLGTGKGFDVNYLFSHIFGGGLMLGAWFMATDYVTTPITPRGQYVYGVCLGVLTAVFRLFGGSAEGVSYAIIFCNLLVPLIFGKVKKREQSKKIMDVLEKVNIAELKDKRVNQLSGGQKQRVAIARALINSPEYILADEPTGALDSNTSDDIMDVFEELNKNGHTVIIVTHDNGVAARCQRVIEIKDGEVLSE